MQPTARRDAASTTPGGGVWIEYLSSAECWTRLRNSKIGRLGVLVDSAPEIYPVNFVVDAQSLVFRTDPGNKFKAMERSPSVCLEVDGIDHDRETGWSVLAKGRASEVTTPVELDALAGLPLSFWGIGEKAHWLRVAVTEVTGRCIRRGADDGVTGD